MHNTGIIDNKLNLVQCLAMIHLINYEEKSNIRATTNFYFMHDTGIASPSRAIQELPSASTT